MAIAFLSHSSKDKQRYVEVLARILGPQSCVYDAYTFEEGMRSIDEIYRHLDRTDLFVLLLSDDALNSEWVRTELDKARELFESGNLHRIFPIVIDDRITYGDSRIPSWMRDAYNIKPIRRPTIAARRIQQRLREISWLRHPLLAEREKVFVGRNELIDEIERRLDSFDDERVISLIASGIDKIGRKSLLIHCLKKGQLVSDSYQPPIISLDSHESIEDFILKVNDLGITQDIDTTLLLSRPIQEKVVIAAKLLRDIQTAREFLFVYDSACIVTPNGAVVDWFVLVLSELRGTVTSIGIASKYRINRHKIRDDKYIFAVDVPELDRNERNGLLKRYSEFLKLELTTDDYKYFSNVLSGLPEQVIFAVELISEFGTFEAKRKTDLIAAFNTDKVSVLISKYEENAYARDMLGLLAHFDFISFSLLEEIIESSQEYWLQIDELIAAAICERIGANKEYLRLNEAVRDYVSRVGIDFPKKFKMRIRDHVDRFVTSYDDESRDISDVLYSFKAALLEGKEIDEKYLIPSHFLKTMVELYNKTKKYEEVVRLADRVLENSEYLDREIKTEIQRYLCLALARMKKKRFLEEVKKIQGPDHNFLFGFYYRLIGKYDIALERLQTALRERPNFPRAKRELVQVYLMTDEFEKARELARENYQHSSTNPYQVQAYAICLIRGERLPDVEKKILELFDKLEEINSSTSLEMLSNLRADYLAYFKNKPDEALTYIDDVIHHNPKSLNPKLTKLHIAERFGRTKAIREVIGEFSGKRKPPEVAIQEAILAAKDGRVEAGLAILDSITDYSPTLIERSRMKIYRLNER